MKRKWTSTLKCAHEGCSEYARYEYDTRSEYLEASKRRVSRPAWTCIRHTNPEELLSPTNLETTFESISTEKSYGKFWGSNGFVHGNGYKAYADDFPVGTKLIVTARIVLPNI